MSGGPAMMAPAMAGPAMSGGAAMSGNGAMMSASSAGAGGELPIEDLKPSLDGVTTWLNSPPLSMEALRGKVVLIDFWTYSCINCLRAVPYVRAWAQKYAPEGLVVIGVHTPEFAFEKSPANVRRAVADLQIAYPLRSTMTTQYGGHSTTVSGRRTISLMQRGASVTIISVRVVTKSPSG